MAPPLTLTLRGIPAEILVNRATLRGKGLVGFQIEIVVCFRPGFLALQSARRGSRPGRRRGRAGRRSTRAFLDRRPARASWPRSGQGGGLLGDEPDQGPSRRPSAVASIPGCSWRARPSARTRTRSRCSSRQTPWPSHRFASRSPGRRRPALRRQRRPFLRGRHEIVEGFFGLLDALFGMVAHLDRDFKVRHWVLEHAVVSSRL